MPVQQIMNQLQAAQGKAKPLITIPFSYVMSFASLASKSVNNVGTLQIQADSDFLVVETAYAAIDQTTVLDVAADGLIQLTDSGSGSNLFSSAIPLSTWFGTAQLPFLLPQPKLLSANATITGSLSTNTLANATSFYLAFHGMKVYKPS